MKHKLLYTGSLITLHEVDDNYYEEERFARLVGIGVRKLNQSYIKDQ